MSKTEGELREAITQLKRKIDKIPNSASSVKWRRELRELQAEMCALTEHEYAMIYNDGTTCMNCGHHRGFGEESGVIRSVSGVEVPALLCDLARALPMPVCPPEHTAREHPNYCKACDESRDEVQQLVGDGDLNAISIVVGVYLRRLYAEHEEIVADLEFMMAYHEVKKSPVIANKLAKIYQSSGVLEMIFGEVLSDKDRDIPTDEKAVQMIREMLEPLEIGVWCRCGHSQNIHGDRVCGGWVDGTPCRCEAFIKEAQ